MRRARPHRGFSLAELLLAIFILGIGVIAIAALFPAGIAQQRQSADDVLGAMVADNALAVIRSKVSPEDFGTLEEFNGTSPTIPGDWPWARPAFFSADTTLPNGVQVPGGSMSIFNATLPNTSNGEVPWNSFKYGLSPPPVQAAPVITQGERFYPMRSSATGGNAPPQYVWDCMFRRFQGKVLVAIFVYRVTVSGGGQILYRVPPNPSFSGVPPLPIHRDFTAAGDPWDTWGLTMNDPDDDAFVAGTLAYDPSNDMQSWQEPGQWLLDQNNNVHRVLSRTVQNGAARVELVRPVPEVPDVAANFIDRTVANVGYENVVTNIWYVPADVLMDVNGDGSGDVPVNLTPVYLTVREL